MFIGFGNFKFLIFDLLHFFIKLNKNRNGNARICKYNRTCALTKRNIELSFLFAYQICSDIE